MPHERAPAQPAHVATPSPRAAAAHTPPEPAPAPAPHPVRRSLLDGPVNAPNRPAPDPDARRRAVARAISGPPTGLPFAPAIQRSFGSHSIAGVRAHVGRAAEEGARALGAAAFAAGDHVVFGRTPDLHTAAHEAAHVVQQAGGVRLSRGFGKVGDAYEQHADQVADRVVAGQSAEPLLSRFDAGAGPASQGPLDAPVQLVPLAQRFRSRHLAGTPAEATQKYQSKKVNPKGTPLSCIRNNKANLGVLKNIKAGKNANFAIKGVNGWRVDKGGAKQRGANTGGATNGAGEAHHFDGW